MNIIEILREQAAMRPAAPAIIDRRRRGRDRSLTFAGLERASAQTAALLRDAGLQPGDRVLVFHPMSAELYVVLLALFRLGLVAVFLDPSAGRDHIDRCCAIAEPRALIASVKAHALRLLSPALRRIRRKFVIGSWLPGATSINQTGQTGRVAPLQEIVTCASDAPALLTFTSGGTGEPKAALRSHGFLLAQHRVLARSLSLAAGEVDLATLPIFALANLASGVTSVIADADLRRPCAIDPSRVLAQIRAHRPVTTVASPALLERLADHCLARGERLTGFERIYTGGAPVFPRLLDKLQTVAPRAEVIAVYGSTEAEPIAHIARGEMQPEEIASMLGGRGLLAGRLVPEIKLRILPGRWGKLVSPLTNAEFDAACARTGEPGEIVVAGEHVLSGYWRGQGDGETKLQVCGEVWHRTGDAGFLDEAGRLWLLGRAEARIDDARGTLHPFAVECAAVHHAGVRRAALVADRGRRLLVIEPDDAAHPPDLAALRRSLAWAELDEVRCLKWIPVDRRHNAKVDYPRLRRMLGARNLWRKE